MKTVFESQFSAKQLERCANCEHFRMAHVNERGSCDKWVGGLYGHKCYCQRFKKKESQS